MIVGKNQLTEDVKNRLKQGSKVEFIWHGDESLLTGRIEIDQRGEFYFVPEHCYENDKLKLYCQGLRFYNKLDDFFFFNYFKILKA